MWITGTSRRSQGCSEELARVGGEAPDQLSEFRLADQRGGFRSRKPLAGALLPFRPARRQRLDLEREDHHFAAALGPRCRTLVVEIAADLLLGDGTVEPGFF